MKGYLLSGLLFMGASSMAWGISLPIKNGTSAQNVAAKLITTCQAFVTTDDLVQKTVYDQRIRNLSTVSSSQRNKFFTALSESTDPTSGTNRFSDLSFELQGLNQIGLFYADPTVPSPNGGIYFEWETCLNVRVYNGTGDMRQITYYSDPATPTDTDHYCYEGPEDGTQLYIPLVSGLLDGRSVLNREQVGGQSLTDDITLGWVPNPIIPAPIPVNGNFYEPLNFTEAISIEDAYHDLDGDGVANNLMSFLFADLLADGASAVANYTIEIGIPGELESRCQNVVGSTDPNLVWYSPSGSGEQGRVDYDTEKAYLNY